MSDSHGSRAAWEVKRQEGADRSEGWKKGKILRQRVIPFQKGGAETREKKRDFLEGARATLESGGWVEVRPWVRMVGSAWPTGV